MKTKLTLALCLVTSAICLPAFAQGTAFTYQGRLNDSGGPASGSYDLSFALFDAPNAGLQQGNPVTNSPTLVSNGLFAVTLDFGNQFSGADRWLEIGVRTNGLGGFNTLAPRQSITATPYSIRSANAGLADTATSVPATALSGTVLEAQLSTNVAILNANQTFTGSNTFSQRVTVNGVVESLSGGVKFPDGSVQTKAAVTPHIIAAVDMQFSQDDRSGWTHVEALGDDACFNNIPLGFTYTGFGINTTNLSVSSNGILFFGNNCSTAFNNTALPSSISIDAMLFFFWDDLYDDSAGEYFEYATFGTPGGRVFNLYFRNGLLSFCGTDAINIMISIHESSGLIKASYSGFSGCPQIRGASATFGFQTPGGASSTAFTVGVDSPVLDDNTGRQTMSFHPPN